MRYYLIFLLSVFSLTGFAQQTTYQQFKDEALNDIRLLPEYGHKEKNEGQVKADNEFIKTAFKADGTPRKASDHLISLGFKYLYQGDLKTAMYRFNQAYLLDAKNENIYWGYGAVYGYFNDYIEAFNQYDKGLSINPNNAVILTDKATLYFVQFQQEQGADQKKLDTAISLLQKSYAANPKNENTTYKLSICYFLNQDCTNARRFYDECMKLGGKPITADYTAALEKQCKK